MNPPVPPPTERPASKRFWYRLAASKILVLSILAHLLFGVGATYFIVQSIQTKRKPIFKGNPPSSASRTIEHKVKMVKKQQSMSAPQVRRIATAGPAAITLPEMPEMPSLDAGMSQMAGAANPAGFGAGTMGSGGAGGGPPVSFFGLQDSATSVLFILDSSMSNVMGNKSPKTYRALEEEVFKTINKFGAGTKFNVILYAPRLWTFRKNMAAATEETKKAAIAFIKENSVATALERGKKEFKKHAGTRMDLVIEEAFRLKPDTIFFVSDGAQTNPKGKSMDQPELIKFLHKMIEDRQKKMPTPIKIHTIVYKLRGGGLQVQFMKDIAKRNGGKFKQVQ